MAPSSTGRKVDETDEVRLALSPGLDEHARSVHHVAHPQLTGALEGESPPVLVRRLGRRLRHQPVTRQQAVYRRQRQRDVGGHPALARLLDHQRYAQLGIVLLDLHQQVRDLLR
jgi:hypothetical protein